MGREQLKREKRVQDVGERRTEQKQKENRDGERTGQSQRQREKPGEEVASSESWSVSGSHLLSRPVLFPCVPEVPRPESALTDLGIPLFTQSLRREKRTQRPWVLRGTPRWKRGAVPPMPSQGSPEGVPGPYLCIGTFRGGRSRHLHLVTVCRREKWSQRSRGLQLKHVCEAQGRRCVRLPSGHPTPPPFPGASGVPHGNAGSEPALRTPRRLGRRVQPENRGWGQTWPFSLKRVGCLGGGRGGGRKEEGREGWRRKWGGRDRTRQAAAFGKITPAQFSLEAPRG